MTDAEFVDQLRRGDRESFRLLIDQFQTKVLNTCFGFLKDKEDAEDVAQEVFTEVYRSIAKFRGDSSLSTWIYRIAVTRSIDATRAKQRMKRFGQLKRFLGFHEVLDELKATDDTMPDLQLEEKERMQILFQGIEALPENQRVAITLAKLEGFSYTEVADIMETTIASVESLLFRARKNLEKNLSLYFEKRIAKQRPTGQDQDEPRGDLL